MICFVAFVFGAPCESSSKELGPCWIADVFIPADHFSKLFFPIPVRVDFPSLSGSWDDTMLWFWRALIYIIYSNKAEEL